MNILQFIKGNPTLGTILGITLLILLFLIIFVGVIRVPQTKVAYIQGFDKRIVTGKMAFYLRFFEKVTYLDVSLLSSDISMENFTPTFDFINIKADTLLKFQLFSDRENLKKSLKLFLNKKEENIKETVEQILRTNLVEIISQFTMKEIVQKKKEFNIRAYESLKEILDTMGIDLVYFSVYKVTDEKGVIHDLESENVAKLLKEARISKAQAERDTKEVEIKIAEEIAERTNQFEMKKAQLRQEVDTKRAVADTIYEIEKQKRLKELEELTEAVNTLKETNKEKLAKYRINTAEAKLKEEEYFANLELYKKQKEAEVMKISTETEIENMKLRALAEAESSKLKAISEAESMKIKANSEAEIINQKAEIMKKYGEIGIIDQTYLKGENIPQFGTGVQPQPQVQPQMHNDIIELNGHSNQNNNNNYDYINDLTEDNEFV